MKSSREQFEEWFNEIMKPAMEKIGIDWPERQLVNDVSWSAWKASRAAIEIEFPPKEDPENFFCEVYSCDLVHESLANCGLKVKS